MKYLAIIWLGLMVGLGRYGSGEYLVLLQNNMELRPTGGFLGSYARVKVDQGRVTEIKVRDIYGPDGQLPGYVQPPEPIYQHLNSNGWFLRDSNWEPDFTKAAPTIDWFFTQGKEPEADGIIAVNLNVVKSWLEAVEPVYLADYRETVTAENLFAKAEYYSEIDFFPGSTQKQDFLGQLAAQLLEKTKAVGWRVKWQLLKAAYRRLQARDILVWVKDVKLQQLVEKMDWDGTMKLPDCPKTQECLTDYLMIVEANLGVNKTNCCLERKVDHQVAVTPGKLQETITIGYKNHNPAKPDPPKTWGGGYKNYLRVYLPKAAQLESVKINQALLQLSEVDQEIVNDFLVIGFLVEVGGGESGGVEINYSQSVPPANRVYRLKVQKQSGTSDDPYSLTFQSPTCPVQQLDRNLDEDFEWEAKLKCK